MYRPNRLKETVRAGRKALGLWVNLASAMATEIVAQAGYDFLILDNEHSAGSLGDVLYQLQALSATPTTAVLRVPWNDPVYLKRALDLGVEAVMIPMIETEEEAKRAVAACRYPPQGFRGAAFTIARGADYGAVADYVQTAAERLLIMAQIESKKGVDNIDAIAAVEGIDLIFVGPNDLSGSLGKLGRFDDAEVMAQIARAEAGIRRAGKPMGTVPHGKRGLAELYRDGYSIVAASSDITLLRDGARVEVAAFRRLTGQ